MVRKKRWTQHILGSMRLASGLGKNGEVTALEEVRHQHDGARTGGRARNGGNVGVVEDGHDDVGVGLEVGGEARG